MQWACIVFTTDFSDDSPQSDPELSQIERQARERMAKLKTRLSRRWR